MAVQLEDGLAAASPGLDLDDDRGSVAPVGRPDRLGPNSMQKSGFEKLLELRLEIPYPKKRHISDSEWNLNQCSHPCFIQLSKTSSLDLLSIRCNSFSSAYADGIE